MPSLMKGSEAQKYQGHLYRPDKENKKPKGGDKRKSINGQTNSQAMIPKGAYVEDAYEGDDGNAVAIVDVPPRAPTPPPVAEDVNVFDFLVTDATPKGAVQAPNGRKALEHKTPHTNDDSQQSRYSHHSQFSNGDGSQYMQYGYSYGNAPLQPGFDRFDSWNNMTESQQSAIMPPPYETPAPKEHKKDRKDKRTGEKRKRNVEELDFSSVKRPQSRDEHMTDAPMTGARSLHSGLTGGLSRLVTDQEFYEDRIEAGPTPISPLKRSKREKDAKEYSKSGKEERRKSSYVSYSLSKGASSKVGEDKEKRRRSRSPDRERNRHVEKVKRNHRDDSFSSEDRSNVSRRKVIEYPTRAGSVQPTSTNQVVTYDSRAAFFMSLVKMSNESERGYSMNKVLKRYHRDLELTRSDEKEEEDKELWKSIRLRRNSRGEIVLFS